MTNSEIAIQCKLHVGQGEAAFMGRKQEVSPGSPIFSTQDQYFDYVIKPRNTNS
jgi:hypothetical protein